MTADRSFDTVIIGGGHNGLVCASYLAQAGLSVGVFERRAVVGGAAVTEEFAPGFRNSICSYWVSLLHPKVIADLELARFGLKIVPVPGGRLYPSSDGNMYLSSDLYRKYRELDRRAAGDSRGYQELSARLEEVAAPMRSLMDRTPPNMSGGIGDLLKVAAGANDLRRLSENGRNMLLNLLTRSVGDILNDYLQGERIKGAYGYSAFVGNLQSPFAAGTGFMLLYYSLGGVNGRPGTWGQAIGGMGAITQAMARSAESRGVFIQTAAAVTEVITKNGIASGIVLADGTVVKAKAVIANVSPTVLYGKMVDSDLLPREFQRKIKGLRCGSGVVRMNVALAELPRFASTPGHQDDDGYLGSSMLISPSLKYLDEAYEDAKRGGWSQKPVIQMAINSVADPSLAPDGKHVASIMVQQCSPQLPGNRRWEDHRDDIADLAINTITEHAPNFKNSVIARQVLTPKDLENEFGLPNGDIYHGAMHLDQIFSQRPAIGYADYRTPVQNLFMCGSGAHPGGGVTGIPGRNAAREILRDFRAGKVSRGHRKSYS